VVDLPALAEPVLSMAVGVALAAAALPMAAAREMQN
jgi:hypothetical protein